MKCTTLTKDQLRSNLAALQALIDDRPIEYYSPALGQWCETGEVCCDFEHRPKPCDANTDAMIEQHMREKAAELGRPWTGQLNVEAAVAASLKKQPSMNVEDY